MVVGKALLLLQGCWLLVMDVVVVADDATSAKLLQDQRGPSRRHLADKSDCKG